MACGATVPIKQVWYSPIACPVREGASALGRLGAGRISYGDLIATKNERDDVDADENDKRKNDGSRQIVDLDGACAIFQKCHQRI